MLSFLFHESSAKMCCTSREITANSVLITGNTIQASNNCNLLFFNILNLRCQTVAGMFGLCVSFSGTKLSYFSCVVYELNFHSVFDVATSRLKVESIRNSLCCLSKLNEGLPPSCNILSCSKCVYKQLSCIWCQPCKNSLVYGKHFSFDKQGKCWRDIHSDITIAQIQRLGLSYCTCHRFCKAVLCVCVGMTRPWIKLFLPV